MGGKSGQVIGHWYPYLIHFGIGDGPVDALLEWRGGDRTAWQGVVAANATISIAAPNLWGGEKGPEGGIDGIAEILFGAADQGPSTLLNDVMGSDACGYRDVFTIVFKGKYGAFNPYPKRSSFKFRRIYKGWDNDICWYPEKALIRFTDDLTPPDWFDTTHAYSLNVYSMAFDAEGNAMMATHSGRAEYRPRGGSWTDCGQPASTAPYDSVCYLAANDTFYFCNTYGSGTETNRVATCPKGSTAFTHAHYFDQSHEGGYLATVRGQVVYHGWINTGAWPAISPYANYSVRTSDTNWTDDYVPQAGEQVIAFCDTGAEVLALLSDGTVWAAASLSSSWSLRGDIGSGPNGYFARSPAGVLMARHAGGLSKSTDNGATWTAVTNAGGAGPVWAFDAWWVAAYGNVSKSTDDGATWALVYSAPGAGGGSVGGLWSNGVNAAMHFHAQAGGVMETQGAFSPTYGMNLAHVVYDSLTCKHMQGEPIEDINDASFRAAADKFYTEGFGVCTEYDGSRETYEQFRQRLGRLGAFHCTKSRVDGKWYLDLMRDDYDVESLPVLTDLDILDFEEEPSSLDDAVNQVFVEWFDPEAKEKRTTPAITSLGAVRAFGGVVAETFRYPEIPYERLALRVGDRELHGRATPLKRHALVTNRKPYSWRRGQRFRLQSVKHGIADMVCTLGEINVGQLASGAIRLRSVQDIGRMPLTTYVDPSPGSGSPAPLAPQPATAQLAFEVPYVDLAQRLSAADLASLNLESGYLGVVAARPQDNSSSYSLLTAADGEGFVDRGTGYWCPSATVVEAVTIGAAPVDVTLDAATDLEEVSVGDGALWGSEVCRVDAIDADAGTATLARGCADTVPVAHAAGQRIWFYRNDVASDDREYLDGELVHAKVLTRVPGSELPEASATAVSTTMNQRHARPYPPGQFEISGDSYPASITGSATTTWVHRNRETQADQLVDTSEAGVTPPAGLTYTVRYYKPTNTLIASQTGITGTSASSYTFASAGTARITVEALQDGLGSWQLHDHEFEVPDPAYLGDITPAPLAVYSLRQMVDGATNAIRVRRSSDNAEQDIGFSGGTLDTAALASFVGSNSAYVTTWYDQTGNGWDFVQATSGSQPRIVNAGTYDGALVFDGSDDYLSIASLTLGTPYLGLYSMINIGSFLSHMGIFQTGATYNTAGGASWYTVSSLSKLITSEDTGGTNYNSNQKIDTTGLRQRTCLFDRTGSGSTELKLFSAGSDLGYTHDGNSVDNTGNFATQAAYLGRAEGNKYCNFSFETFVIYAADTASIRADIEALVN